MDEFSMEGLMLYYGYEWNDANSFHQSTNKYLPDIDVDGMTIYYKYGPLDHQYYPGDVEITCHDDLEKLIVEMKAKAEQ